ncbi:MAG: hypothetical protein JO340_15270 [Acidobacteriaceae bacterium]|nr:hypothetical protein [Acidobacteriaceae bacterium]
MVLGSLASAANVSGVIHVIPPGHSHPRADDLSAANIVVWLQSVNGPAMQPIANRRAGLLQKNKTFKPHVLAIQVGTVVDFPNEDPIFHSAFSNYNGQLFDLGLYAPGTTRSVRFKRPGIVRVFCNIHPNMAAVILVLDTPFFTTAASNGAYRIPDVPPGVYKLFAFDERASSQSPADPSVVVSVPEADISAPELLISEEDYLPAPHKNKYGLDYPPSSEQDSYSGAPQ